MRRFVMTSAVAWVMMFAAAAPAAADEQIYEMTLRATAWVVADDTSRTMYGTAAVVDAKKKLLVTNAHVVGRLDRVTLYFAMIEAGDVISDPREYLARAPKVSARVLIRDPWKDLAVLEAGSLPQGVRELKPAGRSARPGQRVHSVGNSGFRGGVLWRYSKGDVRQVYDKLLLTEIGTVLARVLETDAPINRGDSGGPVVNEAGELVGIVHSFDQENRLVTNNIDIAEVKEILARSQAPPSTTPRPDSLAGAWRMSFSDGAGAELFFDATIRDDGTMSLRGKESFQATWKVKDGQLTLTLNQELVLEGPMTRHGADRFSFDAEGTTFLFTRVR